VLDFIEFISMGHRLNPWRYDLADISGSNAEKLVVACLLHRSCGTFRLRGKKQRIQGRLAHPALLTHRVDRHRCDKVFFTKSIVMMENVYDGKEHADPRRTSPVT